jgi:ABC-type multidrug transport system fused ATPase/permease subunit
MCCGAVTVVIIADRLSTVENAGRVYVLDEGRVIEAGSYHELRHRTLKALGRFASSAL